jgi:hypothetical protein
LTIVEDEVVYKLGQEVKITEAGTEESSEHPAVPEPPLLDPAPAPAPVLETRRADTPQPRNEAGPNKE